MRCQPHGGHCSARTFPKEPLVGSPPPPSLPPVLAGEGYLDYNVRRWGSDGWCAGLRRSGRPDGATFSDWRWWPNSLKAHQLLLLAQEQGKGREAKEALLRAT